MFGFSKRDSGDDAHAEFKALADRMWSLHDCDSTPHDELLHAMAVIENEIIDQSGAYWDSEDHGFYLDLVKARILKELDNTPAQIAEVEKSAAAILNLGHEMEDMGKSSTNAKPAVAYLITRVVEWTHKFPQA